MNKAVKKTAIALGAAAGAAVAVAGAVYEGTLNINFHNKLTSLGAFDIAREEDKEVWQNQTYSKEGEEWFDKSSTGYTAMYSTRIGRNTFAEIIKNDSGSDNWAILLHGYTSKPRDMSHYALHYYKKGYNVLFPHMIGHGPDGNKHCSMGYYDRLIVLDWIEQIVRENPNAKILVHGVSMGGATTMLVTGLEELPSNVKCAVSDCGYTSVMEEFSSQVKNMVHMPAFPLLNIANGISILTGNCDFNKCSPLNAVIKSHTPTLFIHGEKDDFVPFEMAERVYEACNAKEKEFLPIPDAGHANAVFFHNDMYWNKVDEFTERFM